MLVFFFGGKLLSYKSTNHGKVEKVVFKKSVSRNKQGLTKDFFFLLSLLRMAICLFTPLGLCHRVLQTYPFKIVYLIKLT